MQIPERLCTNCGHFVRHYRKLSSCYKPVYCGFCSKRDLTAKEKRRIPSITDCSEWIPMEVQLEKRREEICETLRMLADRIDTISKILLDDEEIKNNLRK